ncbi:MAG: UDP-N-acetyl-D-mannosamine dehydrogenase [Actinobacteria bacterium]|nr:UDP-N-acetyl-D-mannosamine dehydrogenase [Actinomycetota bacterium]
MDNPFYSGTVAVIGLGYIGLPTAVVLASRGVRVIGVDVNAVTVERVARGEIPFFEPDLQTSLSGAVALGNISTSTEPPVADAYIIAVPTPITPNEEADLTHVFAAAASIAPQLRPGAIVVLESTSPPGTTQELSRRLAEARPDLTFPGDTNDNPDIHVAHCPERVLPGRLMVELVENNRVIGGLTPDCAEKAAELYRVFCRGEIQLSDAASAEMAKLAENSYRDVNIAFANELSIICDKLGLDVWEIVKMANHHPRVNILQPGPGVGGHCIAVDPWFLVSAAPDEAVLIRTAREINDGKARHVVQQIRKSASRFREPVVACLGLSYKANVDDVRESPAVEIVASLAEQEPGTRILVSDPMLRSLPSALNGLDNLTLVKTQEAVSAADIVVLLVDHNQFRTLPRKLLDGKVILDTRGIWR